MTESAPAPVPNAAALEFERAFVKAIRRLGLARVLEIQRDAFDRIRQERAIERGEFNGQ